MRISEVFEKQKKFFLKGETLSESFRKEQLKKLYKGILENEQNIYEAVRKDLGKSKFECYETETGIVLEEVSYMLKNLQKLMKPVRVPTPFAHFPARSRIYREPYGSVLIMAPWNYPFQLAIAPLAGCIAAGNCAVLKPSNYSPETSAIIKSIIEQNFPDEYICVAEGGREVNHELLDLPFNYIFFTGGIKVGKLVMEKAAKHLTPVTLELGGKSPCIVDETADIHLSAKRIAWGKLLNCGQTCVAPDYVLAHRDIYDKLIEELKKSIFSLYGSNPHKNINYPKIINEKHFVRLQNLLENSCIIAGGESDEKCRKISPALIDADWDCEVMKEEIFGPLLPIIPFDDICEAARHINERAKPLALYLFTKSEKIKKYIVNRVSYGGGCINDTIVHLASSHMPFGGVGESGMGAYHGKNSFMTFSHQKSVLEKKNWLDMSVRYSPNSESDYKLLKKLMK